MYEFKEDIYLTLSTLPLTNIDRLLEFNKKYTAAQVFMSIIKDMLLDYERAYPYRTVLKLPQPTCLSTKGSYGDSWTNVYYKDDTANYKVTFYDNSLQVFYGLLPEDDLSLVPIEIKRLQVGRQVDHPSGCRQFDYEAPVLRGSSLSNYNYYSGIFSYPVIEDMKDTDVLDLKRCWILLIRKNSNVYRTFKHIMVVRICEYILNLKENYTLPGLPVEVFGSLNKVADRYREIVEKEMNSALTSIGWD